MSFFGLLNNTSICSIGALSELTGKRPSSFFEWNDENDWVQRLFFDIEIVSQYKKKEQENLNANRR